MHSFAYFCCNRRHGRPGAGTKAVANDATAQHLRKGDPDRQRGMCSIGQQAPPESASLDHRWLGRRRAPAAERADAVLAARKSTGRRMTYDEYLQHAEECERLAESATLPINRHPCCRPRRCAPDGCRCQAARRRWNKSCHGGFSKWQMMSRDCSPRSRNWIHRLTASMDALSRTKVACWQRPSGQGIRKKMAERDDLLERLPGPPLRRR